MAKSCSCCFSSSSSLAIIKANINIANATFSLFSASAMVLTLQESKKERWSMVSKYARRGPVVAQIVITIAQNFLSPIVTYRNKSHRYFMLVSERICTYQFVTNRLQVYNGRDNHVRSQWNRELDRNNPIGTYVVVAILEPRSYHQKLTNRDIIAFLRNKSYQNALARIISYSNVKC